MIRVSELTKKEVEAADMLTHLYGALGKLSVPSRLKVYARWEMLHLILPDQRLQWEREVRRITEPR